MGKLNVVMLRYLSKEHFRVLIAVSGQAGGGRGSLVVLARPRRLPVGALPTQGVREGALRAGRTAPPPVPETAARLPICGWHSTSLEHPIQERQRDVGEGPENIRGLEHLLPTEAG